MLRVITSSTHRRYQEAVKEAEAIPHREAELADLREKLKVAQNQQTAASRVATDLESARQAGAEIAAVLTQPDARQSAAIGAFAVCLLHHAQALGVGVERLQSGKPYNANPASSADSEVPRTHPETGDGLHLPYVYVYAHRGEICSVYRRSENAVRQAHASGAPPVGWCQDANGSGTFRPMPFSVYPLPVWESWPDRSHVHLLLRGNRPVAAYGTEHAARRACAITTMMATTGLALSVASQPVVGSRPSSVPDEHGVAAHRSHALMLAAMASGKCAAMRRNKLEPPNELLQLCANLRAAAGNLACSEEEIDEVARPWETLLT
ncbi:hypothetical protein [Streptomyces sp. NPDC017964]|uniref:hypothetical protein n=1 Tax=Streptomyces sp. NPDC017964 TaxID=3365022 RepID=UPI0037962BB1